MTFWVNTKRIFRSGFVNFWRNRVVSLAAVLIMTVTLSTMGLVIFLGALLDSTLEQIKNKVDINIYFSLDASEEDIGTLDETLKKLPEVAATTFTSRSEALEKFRERHKDDYLTIQALEELGQVAARQAQGLGRVLGEDTVAVAAGGQRTPYSVIVAPDGEKIPVNGAVSYSQLKSFIDSVLANR